jgi:hypothetical protein
MLHRLLTPFRGRRHQAYQISRWRRVKPSDFNTQERLTIRQACNCLFEVTEEMIDLLSPQDAGTFFSVVHECVECLVVWIGFELDGPADDHINLFSRQLRDYINTRFPGAAICTTAVRDLAKLVTDALQRARARNPEYAEVIEQVSQPGWTDDQIQRLFTLHLQLVKRTSRALFRGLLPKLTIEYSFVEMLAFTSAYRRESRNLDDDFPLLRDDLVELEIDETEGEYEAFGARVELLAFCRLAVLLPPPETACSICVTDFDGKEDVGGNHPVLTKCKHFFHWNCLDKWVNESAMKTSNTCPECRTVLCEPRKRLHASLGVRPAVEREDDASSVINSSAAASVVAETSWPRLQRLNARIAGHLSRRGALSVNHEWSDTNDSSMYSNDSGGLVVPRWVTEITRAERRDQLRIVNV